MVKKRIPKKIKKKIDKFLDALAKDAFPVDQAILFGSWATGKANKDSDVDLCIVSSGFRKKDPWDYLWNKRLELDDYWIQPLGYTPKDFCDEDPLVWEIKKTGIRF